MSISVRVLVWGPACLSRDIILRLLEREADFKVAAPHEPGEDLTQAVGTERPDVIVVIGKDPESIASCRSYLSGTDPGVVLVVADDARTLHRLQRSGACLPLGGELTPDLLIRTIRRAAQKP